MDCRKSVRSLTQQERRDFLKALRRLKRSGDYDQLVRTHFEAVWRQNASNQWQSKGLPNDAHGGPAFLPWHRKFLREFETKLQNHVSGVTLPYWNWREDARIAQQSGGSQGETLPVFENDSATPTDGLLGGDGTLTDGPFEDGFKTSPPFDWDRKYDSTGGISRPVLQQFGPNADRPLERSMGNTSNLPQPSTVDAALTIDKFHEPPFDSTTQSFRNVLEGWMAPPASAFPSGTSPPSKRAYLHNAVHVWVGGDMLPMTSPNDPVFFLHHCYVDKLWADWQDAHPNAAQFPPNSSNAPDGHRLGTQMPPWNIDPGTMLDYRSVGYVYDTSPPRVELVRPQGTPTTLEFNDVPQGRETSRAAVFEVTGCQTTVTLRVDNVTGPFSVKPSMKTRTHTPPSGINRLEANVWLTYMGQSPGTSASGTATISCPETGESWTVQLSANAIAEPTVGVAMVLDESGSMGSPSGAGSRSRIEVLRDAGEAFLDLMSDDDSLGIAAFHSDASTALSTQTVGGQGSSSRSSARSTIRNLSPTPANRSTNTGFTSIGDGVLEGRTLLSNASNVDERALVVFTDGHENRPTYIADLPSSGTDDKVFAVGLGTPSQIRPAALQRLTNASGSDEGYVLVSGSLSPDDQFLLDKYFIQILAGVTNRDVIVDPQGRLRPESESSPGTIQLPFHVSRAELDLDVILLSPGRNVIPMVLETPGGTVIEPQDVTGSDAQYIDGERLDAFRLPLPYTVGGQQARAGEWTVRLEIDPEGYDQYLGRLEETDIDAYERTVANGVPYRLLVNARSNLSFDARIGQSSFEPGSRLDVTATLEESGLPVSDATVAAAHTRPDGAHSRLQLQAGATPGRFEGSVAQADAGLHAFRLRAQGTTLDGSRFRRESFVTGSLWPGGDDPLPRATPGTGPAGEPGRADDRTFELLACLLEEGAFEEYLDEYGIDREIIEACLESVINEE